MPLTLSATRELLATLGHNPKRFLGQNFLVDGNIVRKSLALAQITSADTVVEIGPGLGTLTTALLETGAHVYAVEKDTTLAAHLAATLAPKYPDTFHLLEGDALDHPLAAFLPKTRKPVSSASDSPPNLEAETNQAALGEKKFQIPITKFQKDTGAEAPNRFEAADRQSVQSKIEYQAKRHHHQKSKIPSAFSSSVLQPFKIVANLPYAISTPWMDAVLSDPGLLPGRMVLMLQQEAAQRYTAVPGTKQYGAISIFLQNACDIAPGHKVSAACFYPRPDIESCLLHLVRKPVPFIFAPETKILIRACFQQRRKQLGALLRDRLPAPARDAWFARLATAGLTPQARPEEIPPALWTHFPSANPPPPPRVPADCVPANCAPTNSASPQTRA